MAAWHHLNFYNLSEVDMRSEKDKQIFKAIEDDDVKTLKQLLTNPSDYRLGRKELSILSVAVVKGARDAVKFLIDNDYNPSHVDETGNTALHLSVAKHGDEKSKIEIVDILLASYSNVVETVFANRNIYGMTPFLLACDMGCDAIILPFLSMLENNSIPIDQFIGYQGNNCFHYRLDVANLSPTIIETVQAMIDKIPFSAQLIDAKNDNGRTPLYKLAAQCNENYPEIVSEVAKIFFQHGVSPDGATFLLAILEKNKSLIDVSLRAGCSYYVLSAFVWWFILKSGRYPKSELVRMVELFLAFGYDLQKVAFLYTIDERPIEYASPKYAKLLDTTGMDSDVVEALRELRRSNKMLSLQRQCRNKIRCHLKGKADVVIGNLTCIPDRIKSFLLVENEQPLLDIPE